VLAGEAPLAVDFVANASADGAVDIWWTYGDGTFGTGESVSKTFALDGTYDVRVTVSGTDGNAVTCSLLLAVGEQDGGDETGSETGGDTGDESPDTSATSSATTTDDAPPDGSAGETTPPGATDDAGTDTAAADNDNAGSDGCGCSAAPASRAPYLLLLGVLLRRRRCTTTRRRRDRGAAGCR
jgi:PKD repeat protein